MKKLLYIVLVVVMLLTLGTGCTDKPISQEENNIVPLYDEDIDTAISDLLSKMSIEEKASQMVQGEKNALTSKDIATYGLGSVLSGGGNSPGSGTQKEWIDFVDSLQDAALSRDIKIPILYGIDALRGNALLADPILFPHNIGLGAANDPELMAKMGEIIAQEMKAASIHWNFGPCVACAVDPRWGRTYESISTDPNLTATLSAPIALALQSNGIIACAKHYIGDGGTTYGTSGQYSIDQGDVIMTEQELRDAFLPPYKKLVDDGVLTVMASFAALII